MVMRVLTNEEYKAAVYGSGRAVERRREARRRQRARIRARKGR